MEVSGEVSGIRMNIGILRLKFNRSWAFTTVLGGGRREKIREEERSQIEQRGRERRKMENEVGTERNSYNYFPYDPFSVHQVAHCGAFRSVEYPSQLIIMCARVHCVPSIDLHLRPYDLLT